MKLIKLWLCMLTMMIVPSEPSSESDLETATRKAEEARIRAEAEAKIKAETETKLRAEAENKLRSISSAGSFTTKLKNFLRPAAEVVLTGMGAMVVGGLAGIGIGYGVEKGRSLAQRGGQAGNDQNQGQQQGGSMSTAEAGRRGGRSS